MVLKSEITTVVKRYLPKLQIDEITVLQSDESEYAAVVTLKYTITDDVFTTTDNKYIMGNNGINYTSRNFVDIRTDLVNMVKQYYPDIFW
jgi:hypothetical protein